MTKTNDWTNFSARLEAALGRKIAEAPWEPWETDSSGMATYRVVMIPRRPSTTPVVGDGGSKSDE
jgi:hypothetical protein